MTITNGCGCGRQCTGRSATDVCDHGGPSMKIDEAGGVKVVYAVQWIEVEFGQRDEGYALFVSKDECISSTQKSSRQGAGEGGYIGPVRPLHYVEIPFDSLDDEYKKRLMKDGRCHTQNRWSPRFRGKHTWLS